ncbi:hypothetical protein CLAFUR4_14544 [Fulvia fulva]|nr:hypothetical protein CLAFUR4_14544 [Fulvia fulva]WPV37542.1 hypothetical protein CLAFUW7_14553 [Fulvia fulva]
MHASGLTMLSARLSRVTRRMASTSRKRIVDETTLAGAQHKVSLSGPSLGHLLSELSATRPGMESLRKPGATMSEGHRTQARQTAKWLMGVPVAFGTVVVGYNFRTKD